MTITLYTIHAIALSDITTTGPDPFVDNNETNPDAITQSSTITLNPDATWTPLEIAESDSEPGAFEDTDQNLATFTTFNGTTWTEGIDVENEYSYVVQPVGSTDPADQVTIYVLEFDNSSAEGIVADGPLVRGVTYEIISGGDTPQASYSDLVVCFAAGTLIDTPDGARPVETLRPGDLVSTLDHGAMGLAWCGRQVARGDGPAAPVRIAWGVLGNDRPLVLSQQHRVLVRTDHWHDFEPGTEVLVPAKALVGVPGVTWLHCDLIVYHHLLFEGHQVIRANGALVESMYPGPMALQALSDDDRAAIAALFPEVASEGAVWTPARPLVRPGEWRRMQQHGRRRA